jgi:hypothetical protein
MDTSVKYALLGKTLFEKCKTSQATSEELASRISQLRAWNKGKVDEDLNFSHSGIETKHFKNLLKQINLKVPYDTPATSEEISYFAEICELTKDAVNINDLFTYDWRKTATEYIDPETKLQYLKVPKGSIIYHGMDMQYPFDTSRVPKYFGTLQTAYPYAFVSFKNRRNAEEGKVIPFRLKEDILVFDISVINNWKILIPTKDSAPKEVIKAAKECFDYAIKSDNIYRSSTKECDDVIYNYFLSLPQTSIASAAGAKRQSGMTDEIVFTDASKLEKVGYALPYEIVMLNNFTSEDAIDCAFVIEARSIDNQRNFRLVSTLSEKDFRIGKFGFKPIKGKTTFDFEGTTMEKYKDMIKMRNQCFERALGNFEIKEF